MRYLTGWLCLLLAAACPAQDEVQIEAQEVAPGIYMLIGQGGNIGVCAGSDGVFMIDDQFAPLSSQIQAAIAELSDQPIRFLVNTHWHFDHTGGNENFGKAGAVIVAHENVRLRLSSDQFIEAFQREVPAAPQAALPIVTFTENLSFHLNGETIEVFHVSSAHTDGDAIVHFKAGNVVHMGDTFFNGMYPFIDTSSGGNIRGVIRAGRQILERIDADTQVIPGHGPLADKAALEAYVAMLETVSARVGALIAEGKSRDLVIAAQPTRDLDEIWGQGFMKPDVWTGIVFDCLSAE